MSELSIYTVWAALREDLSAHWMIWAVDEYSYEGNPGGHDADLDAVKARQPFGTEFREVTLKVPDRSLDAAFDAAVVSAEVEPASVASAGNDSRARANPEQ